MYKRIILSCALALVSPFTSATDAPAWGLIVKLKNDSAINAATTPAPNNIAHAVALDSHPEHYASRAQALMQSALQRAGASTTQHRALMGNLVRHVGTDRVLTHAQAQELARKLMSTGAVEWVVPNERAHLQQVTNPNDPLFSDNTTEWWAFEYLFTDAARRRGVPDLQSAWATTNGSSSPIVAIIDSGITSHPDLAAGQILPGYDFVSSITHAADGNARDNNATDPGNGLTDGEIAANRNEYAGCEAEASSWHGTAVAGVVAAHSNNASGLTGASWGTRILPVRVAGKCGAWRSDIIDGIRWAAGLSVSGVPTNPNPARIINLSLGSDGACSPDYAQAISELRAATAVLVVSAGNDHGAVANPANCPGAVAVVALNRDGFKANYSNFGSSVTIATVGGDPSDYGSWGPYVGDSGIVTIGNTGTQTIGAPAYFYYAGTSMAAPIVSATLSLMLSVNPALSADEMAQGLRVSSRPHVTSPVIGTCSSSNPGRCLCTTQTCGSGILDANRALQYAVYSLSNPASGFSPSVLTADVIDNAAVRAAAATGQDTVPSQADKSENKGGGGSFSIVALLGLALAAGAASHSARRLRAQPRYMP